MGIPGRPSVGAALRRRKAVWLVAAVVGLVLGIGLFKVMPPPYKAVATDSIALIEGVLPTDEVLTEVALAQSRTVAETAMHRLGLPEDPKSVQGFMGRETVTAQTDQIIAFTVKASSANDAVARARALAKAYLIVRAQRLDVSRLDTVKALNAAVATDKKRLAALDKKITSVQSQPTSVQQQTKLASLQAEKSQQATALTALQKAARGYALHSGISNQKVVTGSGTLDSAQATPRSKIKYPVLYAVGGLIAGLAIGMGWVIVSALASTRPRRRYDIARALGAPVRLSVGRIRVSRRSARRAPESAGGRGVQQIARYLHGALPQDQSRTSLAVVAADETVVPALSIVSLALSLVREGKRVILADLTGGAEAGRLLGCAEPGLHRHVAGQRQLTVAIPEDESAPPTGPIRRGSGVVLPQSGDPELEHAYHAADVLLTLVAIDPGFGADHLRTWARNAVVILTAGEPSATKVRTLAELIRLSGTAITSAVVIGADSTDESLGVLTGWDDTDEQASRGEERARRDARLAQRNGSAARSQARPQQTARPEQTERAQARQEPRPESRGDARTVTARPEARAEARSEGRPEPRPDARPEPRPEARPEVRHEARTQPRRVVDLRKEGFEQTESSRPEEDPTKPERARPVNTPGPETMPYAEENVIGSEHSSSWRG
jgi:capsular polysaccharide biosynthesis protein